MRKFRSPLSPSSGPQFIDLNDGRRLPYHRPLPHEKDHQVSDYIPAQFSQVEVEIGAGTGRFISKRAAIYPDRFFLGIDKKKDRIHRSTKKLERVKNQNWSLIWCDARTFLGKIIPPLEILHVYHPDPWPKKRHHKHRFFRSPDARHWALAVRLGGELRISTDQPDYYEEILAIVDSWNAFQLQMAYVKRSGLPQSHFEEIFLRQNLPVFKAYFKKIR